MIRVPSKVRAPLHALQFTHDMLQRVPVCSHPLTQLLISRAVSQCFPLCHSYDHPWQTWRRCACVNDFLLGPDTVSVKGLLNLAF